MKEKPQGALRGVRAASKGAWYQSLRFRLSLAFSLVTMLLVGGVGTAMNTLLLRSLDSQFQLRLADRANTLSERLSDVRAGLGEPLAPTEGSYFAVLGADGRVVQAPPDPRVLYLSLIHI